jgi:hemerythrin-like domain-containing protein
MNIFEILDHEHQLIAPALKEAKSCALRITQSGATVEPVGLELVGFLDKFISQCHQAKEYSLYLRLLKKEHAQILTPIVTLHAENSQLAQLTESLDASWRMVMDGLAGASELVAGYFTDYAALMQAHLQKEDRFYKVVEPILEATDHIELKATFDKLEQETLGAEGHERYCHWAYKLTGQAS